MKLILPVEGFPISLGFGEIYGSDVHGDGWNFVGKRHNGVDFACPLATPVRASADGRVAFSGTDSTGYGNLIKIRHNDGSETRYAHLAALGTLKGKFIGQGQVIGLSGDSGNVTGAHLHWEYRTADGEVVDPMAFLIEPDVNHADENGENVDETGENVSGCVEIVCAYGANVRKTPGGEKALDLPAGTILKTTGKRAEKNGLTHTQVLIPLWIANFDAFGTTILACVPDVPAANGDCGSASANANKEEII